MTTNIGRQDALIHRAREAGRPVMIEMAVKRRAWHMWGCTLIIVTAILLGSSHIASALWSVCPVEDPGVVLRLS